MSMTCKARGEGGKGREGSPSSEVAAALLARLPWVSPPGADTRRARFFEDIVAPIMILVPSSSLISIVRPELARVHPPPSPTFALAPSWRRRQSRRSSSPDAASGALRFAAPATGYPRDAGGGKGGETIVGALGGGSDSRCRAGGRWRCSSCTLVPVCSRFSRGWRRPLAKGAADTDRARSRRLSWLGRAICRSQPGLSDASVVRLLRFASVAAAVVSGCCGDVAPVAAGCAVYWGTVGASISLEAIESQGE